MIKWKQTILHLIPEAVNIGIHVLILFLFLTGLFFLYISKVTQDHIINELNSLLDPQIQSFVQNQLPNANYSNAIILLGKLQTIIQNGTSLSAISNKNLLFYIFMWSLDWL